MIIDTGITIAYKCSACGTFSFFSLSGFKLIRKKEHYFTCRCKKSSITICSETAGKLKLTIPCISCGGNHSVLVQRKRMFGNETLVFVCPQTGLEICYIGRDVDVRSKVDILEKKMDELIDMFGYDSYFKNTSVMLDALNRIHDLAEQGNLYCSCGSSDVDLTLLSDRIHLKCKNCSGSTVIYAASNQDLKNILLMQQIQLIGNGRDSFIYEK